MIEYVKIGSSNHDWTIKVDGRVVRVDGHDIWFATKGDAKRYVAAGRLAAVQS